MPNVIHFYSGILVDLDERAYHQIGWLVPRINSLWNMNTLNVRSTLGIAHEWIHSWSQRLSQWTAPHQSATKYQWKLHEKRWEKRQAKKLGALMKEKEGKYELNTSAELSLWRHEACFDSITIRRSTSNDMKVINLNLLVLFYVLNFSKCFLRQNSRKNNVNVKYSQH